MLASYNSTERAAEIAFSRYSLRWSAVQDKGGAKPVITGRDFVVATIAPPTVEDEGPVAPPPPPEATKQKAPPGKAAAPAAKAAPAKKK